MRLAEIILTETALAEISRIPSGDIDERYVGAKLSEYLRLYPRRTLFGTIGSVKVFRGMDKHGEAFVFRDSEKTAIGYAFLGPPQTVHGIEGNHVVDIGLLSEHQGQGIGPKFYDMLLDKGYTLFSGATQTPDGERMWRRLLAKPDVKISIATDDRLISVDDRTTLPLDPWTQGGMLIASKADIMNEGETIRERWMDYEEFRSSGMALQPGQSVRVLYPENLGRVGSLEYRKVRKVTPTQVMLDNSERFLLATGTKIVPKSKFERGISEVRIARVLAQIPVE